VFCRGGWVQCYSQVAGGSGRAFSVSVVQQPIKNGFHS